MTDHKAEAEHNLSPEFADPRNQPHAAGQEALIHAVLYLAEQQRITNLIAYHSAALIQREAGYDLDDTSLRNLKSVGQQVREGLGVA